MTSAQKKANKLLAKSPELVPLNSVEEKYVKDLVRGDLVLTSTNRFSEIAEVEKTFIGEGWYSLTFATATSDPPKTMILRGNSKILVRV